MVTGSSATVSMLATALLVAAPWDGIAAPAITDFLMTIGGDTKIKTNGSATAERAQAAFAQECAAKDGHIEPDDGKVARSFRERVLGRRLPPRGSFKHFWSGRSAVCARSPSEVMGGFVAITFDNTELATKGDLGARLFSKILLMATRTAVYAYRPDRIPAAASFETHYVPMMLPNRRPTRPFGGTLPSAPRPTAAP